MGTAKPLVIERFDVCLDRFLDVVDGFLLAAALGNATGQIRTLDDAVAGSTGIDENLADGFLPASLKCKPVGLINRLLIAFAPSLTGV